MGARNPFLSPLGPSNLEFPLESHLTIFETSSPGICVMSSLGFMDVEFPSNEAILEAMFLDLRPPPELETLQVRFQQNPWLEPSNGIYLENYYA
jgi:hypothetical protein